MVTVSGNAVSFTAFRIPKGGVSHRGHGLHLVHHRDRSADFSYHRSIGPAMLLALLRQEQVAVEIRDAPGATALGFFDKRSPTNRYHPPAA